MKLKYRFVVREISDQYIAVAVGKDNARFNGMVKLNETGAFLMELLNQGDTTERELLQAVINKYDVAEDRARENLSAFLKTLRDGGLLTE